MIWGLIFQILVLVQGVMSKLVNVTYHFDTAGTENQWNGGIVSASVTQKGSDILGALATMLHMGANFAAQFMLLLPAASSNVYTFTGTNLSGITVP